MQRERLGGLTVLRSAVLRDAGALVAFTERTGGVSVAPYASLNLAFHTGDDQSSVAENRRRATRALGLPQPTTVQQVHGARIEVLPAGQGATRIPGADGVAVEAPGRAVAILVADCVPLVLVAGAKRLVAAHVGWRGLSSGIVGAALDACGDPTRAVAAIGPAIGPCHYEVGTEVVDAVRAAVGPDAVVERRDDGQALDLPETVSRVIEAAGARVVDRAGVCTADEGERFFSYRREGTTGRQAMFAMLM